MGDRGEAALAEWRSNWTLPFAAMVGISTAGLAAYSFGPFMIALEGEFGWSRTQMTYGITAASLIGAAFSVLVGMLVDRIGSRILGLIGVAATTAAIALFSTLTGNIVHWVMLWCLVGVAGLFMQPTVWTKPVASRFDRSRGLALAVTLSGTGIAATVLPVTANWMIEAVGWRSAYPMLAALWALVVLPIVALFFRSAPVLAVPVAPADEGAAPRVMHELQGLSVAEALRTAAFYKLMVVSLFFVLTLLGVVIHFVPLLTEFGASPMRAATMASLIGISSIIGRIGAGLLIDRLPAHLVGTVILMLPIVGSMLLLADGSGAPVQLLAAICFGLALGGEIDVIAFLATRHLGLRNFGTLFGAMIGALSLGAALGPLAAGMSRDWWGSYELFLYCAIACSAVACLATVTLGQPRFAPDH